MIDLVALAQLSFAEIESILADKNNINNQNPSVRNMLLERLAVLSPKTATPTVASAPTTATPKAPAKARAKKTTAPSPDDLNDKIKELATKNNLDKRDMANIETALTYTKTWEKHYQLSLLGLTNKEISFLTGAPVPSIARDVWKGKKGSSK